MTKLTLKLFYDEEIATITHNGLELKSGTEYDFYDQNTSKSFEYKIKNGKLASGDTYFFWGSNKFFVPATLDPNGYDFSEADVCNAYNTLAFYGVIENFLCLTSARYYTQSGLNQKRPLIVCGDYVSKKVENNDSNDTITVTFDKNYQLTNVNVYYRDSSGGQYETRNNGISADKHTFTTVVPHIDIEDSFATNNDYSYVVVPTVLKNTNSDLNSADITLQYNDGAGNKTIVFPKQTSGTITGTLHAAPDGYKITGITEAYYQDRYGNKTKLKNLVATKVSDTEYKFSVDLTDTDITFFKNHPYSKLLLNVATSYIARIDLKLIYNDGVQNQTIVFPNQTAGQVTGSVHAAEGYRITKVTGAQYFDRYGGNFFANFVATKVSDTEYKFSFDVSNDDLGYIKASQDITVQILVFTENTAISANVKVQYEDGVNTQTLSYTNVTAGQKITGEVNAAKGYTITSVTGAHYAEQYGYQVNVPNFSATKISNYKYQFTFVLTDTDIKRFASDPSFIIKLDLKTAKELGNISIDTSNLRNCSVTPSTITENTATKITLSADLGYILDGVGTYTVDDVTTSFKCNKVSSYSFTVTAARSIAVAFTATKTENQQPSILHTYVLDEDGYNLLGKQYVEAINATGDGFTQYDYSKFINYLYEIPFAVTESITKPTETISIGKVSLNVPCQYVTHETLTIELGSIEIPAKDSTDYKVDQVLLIAPFCESLELPYSVLGSTISLAIQINLLNESANLIVSQDDTVIVTRETEIFTDLPLYFSTGAKDTLVKTFKTQYQNTVKQAYISIAYHKPITNLTSYSTIEHGTLSNYKGFTRVTRGTLKNSINEEIDSLIIDSLQEGVIIK